MDGPAAGAAAAPVRDAAPGSQPPPGAAPGGMPLREALLTGRYLGAAQAGMARAVAEFAAGSATPLRDWFGDAGLAAILGHDGGHDGGRDGGADGAGGGAPRARRRALERLREAIDRDIAALDARLHEQIATILAHPRLQRLESSWRGLEWLTERVPYGARVQLRLYAARWAELCRDFERAAEFDQSALFKAVYEEEFGRPGGQPYGLLLADYELRHAPGPGSPTDDVAGLDGLAGVAAAAFSPTAVAAHPVLFGLDAYADAGASLDLTEILRGADRQRWRNLQGREDSRFLAVLLPRVLGRAPWPDEAVRADGFRPRGALGPRLWTNPVYALGATALRAFAQYGWPADIRGATVAERAAGGVVDGLPAERLSGDPPGPPPRPPVELALTDLQERQLVEAGLLPLLGLEGLPEASFAATPGLHRPPRMMAEGAEANQRLSAQFNAILCVSRFAHCIKVMGRDMVGSFRTAEEIELKLQRWLGGFANSSASGSGESAARYPLRGARVEVREQPGRPGVYGCIIHLQPHYQLDEVGAAFRLVTDLQAAKAA
ncbi:type VI secretion system contractile sheath large subunit [Roseomonas sp. OT10]|uniref:type VI secretion system contractile sheath large subunit n=1 Tax=Roseomonas cutis TaxID=2897332 RepID=UPI001E30D80D|nr:type VI secretion system contractile sheath large subunit [Roseomonas sp. OT10]UFN47572.1 type VI secretion system contractile sheath large subunit [Roseomonas sp. OT10]